MKTKTIFKKNNNRTTILDVNELSEIIKNYNYENPEKNYYTKKILKFFKLKRNIVCYLSGQTYPKNYVSLKKDSVIYIEDIKFSVAIRNKSIASLEIKIYPSKTSFMTSEKIGICGNYIPFSSLKEVIK